MADKMEEYSNWQKILDILTSHVKKTKLLSEINAENAVNLCLQDKGIRNIILQFTTDFFESKQKIKENKPADLSVFLREQGNSKFKHKKYEESLLLYTKSILHSTDGSESLSLALSSRSAALYHLSEYKECLRDVDLALSKGYPKPDITKLSLRKGQCLAKLGRHAEAVKIFQEATLKIVDDLQHPLKTILKRELSDISPTPSEIDGSTPLPSASPLPPLTIGVNPSFPSASSLLSVHHTPLKGRHVIAAANIRIGDVLFVEKPFAFVVLKEVCHGCCSEVRAPVPCWDCMEGAYCSSACIPPLHRLECHALPLLGSAGVAHLALRLLLQCGSYQEAASVYRSLPPPSSEDSTSQFQGLGYDAVCGLLAHLADMEKEDLFQYAVTATFLALYLQTHTMYFEHAAQSSDPLEIAGCLLLRHIGQLVCNAHAVTRLTTEPGASHVVCEFQERVATAIYPAASMMNHSCDPNIINSFQQNTLIVRACRAIRKGEEVFNCYGPHYRRMPILERYEILTSQYFFHCQCQPCQEPFDFLERFTALRCKACNGALVLVPRGLYDRLETLRDASRLHPYLGRPPDDIELLVCMDCDQYERITEKRSKNQFLVGKLIEKGKFWLDKGNASAALDKFLAAWKLAKKEFYIYHEDLAYTEDQIARCLAMSGDYKRSVTFLRPCVQLAEVRYGAESVELGNELQKLSDVLMKCLEVQDPGSKEYRDTLSELVEVLGRAEKLFALLYGFGHKSLQEILEKKEKMMAKQAALGKA